MKFMFIGDLHLADRRAANPFTLEKRLHIIDHDDFDKQLITYLNQSEPDHIIFLGDVVDWYCPENIHLAKSFLDQIHAPWSITPGNHDYQLDLILRPQYNDGKTHEWADETPLICKKKATAGWGSIGIELSSQKIQKGNTSIYLLDSAIGAISKEDQDWLMGELETDQAKHVLLATHVPFPVPSLCEIIHSRKTNPKEYIQSNLQPELLNLICQKAQHVCTGHLHFQETQTIEKTTFHLVPLATHLENNQFTSVKTMELN